MKESEPLTLLSNVVIRPFAVVHGLRQTHHTIALTENAIYALHATNPTNIFTSFRTDFVSQPGLLKTKVSFSFQICPDGTIRFDKRFVQNIAPLPTWDTKNFPFTVPMLFPFWSVIDREYSFCSSAEDCQFDYPNRSAVFYQVYTEGSNASYILERASEDVRNNTQEFGFFSASWVLVVTWLRLRPKVLSRKDVKEDIVSPLKM